MTPRLIVAAAAAAAFLPMAAQAYTDRIDFAPPQAIASPGSFAYQHGAYAPAVSSATLELTAFLRNGARVDGAYSVYVWDQYADDPQQNGGWVFLGYLEGAANSVVVKDFDLIPGKSYLKDDIASGLKVQIGVNADGCKELCGMLLGRSDLILTSAVPEPQTYALLAAGLGAVGFAARRRAAR